MVDQENSSMLSSNISRAIVISVGHFLNDFYMNLVPPVLFVFAASLSLSMGQQGFIAFVILGCGSFVQPLFGHMCDRRGNAVFLVYSLLWISFFMSISGLITSYYLLAAATGLGALASALYHPLGSAVTIKLLKRAPNTSLSLFMTIGGLAASVAPLVTLPLVSKYGLNSLACFLVPGFLVVLLMAATRLDKMKAISNEAGAADSPGEAVPGGLKKVNFYSIKWLTALIAVAAIRVWISKGFIVFGVQFLSLKNVSLSAAGTVLTLFLLATALGTFFGGIVTDVIGTKNMMILSFILATASTLLMIIGSGFVAVASFLLTSFFINTSNSSNILIARDIMPQNETFATGMIMGLAGGVGGLGIYLTGAIADSAGLLKAIAFLLIPLLIMSLLNILLPKTATGKPVKNAPVL